jgi:hypothetical protein
VRRLLSLNYVVLAVSIFALIAWGVSVSKWRSYTECQARVVDTVIQVLDTRSKAADEEAVTEHQADAAFRNAMDTLLAQPPRPVAERTKALRQLQQALDDQARKREEVAQVRATHPIPELPSKSC